MIDIVVPPTYRLAPQRGGFGFIVAEELHDFSGTMADFALETPFWRIVTEKSHVFAGQCYDTGLTPVVDRIL